MNKILIDKNKIDNYKDNEIEINGNRVYFYSDNKYEIEYRESDEINLEFIIDNCHVEIFFSSFDNDLKIKNVFNIRNGSLRIDKFYSNKSVNEEIVVNLLEEGDRIDYNFSNICMDKERYIIDINHLNRKTISNINNRAVALKDSEIDFIINSRVINSSVKSILDQNTRILTIDSCEAKICPNMFIDLDDVEARHGSVIGTFKDDQVFYLMSKGISYNDSLKLLIKGYLLSMIAINIDMRMRIIEIIDRYWR